jgi:hypothetical protein
MTPIGCNAFSTVDDLPTSAGALEYSVRAVHSDHLINAGSAVGIYPIYRDGHRVNGSHSPYRLAIGQRVTTGSVNVI